jgi:hypothetical protein
MSRPEIICCCIYHLKIKKKKSLIFFNFEKIRNKETEDGILDYAIPVKVNEREK